MFIIYLFVCFSFIYLFVYNFVYLFIICTATHVTGYTDMHVNKGMYREMCMYTTKYTEGKDFFI